MWQFWWKLQAFHCTNSIKHLHQPWCCHGTACKIQHPSKISKVFLETGDSIRLCRQHPAATLDFISPRTGKHPFFPCMLELRLWHDGRQDIHNQQIYTNMYIRFCFTQEHGNQILLDPICLFPVGPFFAFFSIGFARAVPPEEFLAFPKTTGAEIRIVLGMLYGVKVVGHWVWVNFHKLPTDSQRSEGESIV